MLLIRLFSYLPFWLVYTITRVSAFLWFRVLRYRRSVIRKNLVTSFPEKSNSEIRKIEKKFFTNFTTVFMELMKCYNFTKKDWANHVRLENSERPKSYLDKDIPIILIGGHTANWEWAAFGISRLLGYPFEFIYKPIKNSGFNKVMLDLRQRHGALGIKKDNAIRQIVKRRKEPRIIGIVGDQQPSIGTDKHWSQFLNQETSFYIGAEKIAMMVDYPVFYLECKRVAQSQYIVDFHEISSPPYKEKQAGIIESYVRGLEKTIKESPGDYLWSHNRWKYTKAEDQEKRAALRQNQ